MNGCQSACAVPPMCPVGPGWCTVIVDLPVVFHFIASFFLFFSSFPHSFFSCPAPPLRFRVLPVLMVRCFSGDSASTSSFLSFLFIRKRVPLPVPTLMCGCGLCLWSVRSSVAPLDQLLAGHLLRSRHGGRMFGLGFGSGRLRYRGIAGRRREKHKSGGWA